jgi:hypothetical protein
MYNSKRLELDISHFSLQSGLNGLNGYRTPSLRSGLKGLGTNSNPSLLSELNGLGYTSTASPKSEFVFDLKQESPN